MHVRKGGLPVLGVVIVFFGGVASAQSVAQSRLFGTVLEYPTSGCGGAVVQTPLPGKQFVSTLDSTRAPAAAKLFFAQAAARHVTWATSLKCVHTGRTHVLVPAPVATSDRFRSTAVANGYNSSNWSGYQISNTAQYTQAGWTVPAVAQPLYRPYSPIGYYSSIWSGMGGGVGATGTGPLIQSGSEQLVQENGSSRYYFWYEIVGGPTDTSSEMEITSMDVQAGDYVGNVAIWTPDVPNSSTGTVQLGVCNFTRTTNGNTCVSFIIGGTPQPGESTEWIVEAPSSSIGVLPLADFGNEHLGAATWASTYIGQGSTGYTIAQGDSPTSITLQQTECFNECYDIFSVPGPLDSDGSGFTTTFMQVRHF
ncbi:MAG TPA: G1 family glutamic endopeptidase [Rhodanobacteraceae bacterium]|nr:G1 family glutamic endopeptidase [Rhodanobacteraceae bacterium]